MPTPKISVIVACFNQADFLETSLCSVLDQNYEQLELIVVDGSIDDHTTPTLRHYRNEMDLWLRQRCDSMAQTINLGLDSRPVEIAVDPTSDRIYVAGGGTSAVYVIDTSTNEIVATIREQMGRRPWGIAITPDGSTVYTADGLSDSVSVIDTECLCVVDRIEAGRGAHSAEIGVIPDGQ